MKPVLFVICFTFGVSLMVFSGYLPKSASARTNGLATSDANTASEKDPLFEPRAPIPLSPDGPEPNDVGPVYVAPAEIAPTEIDLDDPNLDIEALRAELADPNVQAALDAYEAQKKQLNNEQAATASEPNAPAEPNAPLPVADAGPDRVCWIGWNDLTLDGTGSTGDGLTYDWMQTLGPQELVIKDKAQGRTSATGFILDRRMSWAPEEYEFELMVVDRYDREAFDIVHYTVISAPDLKITPRAERYFADRDGYMLGQYECWVTNLQSFQQMFEIVSPNELAFTKVNGVGAYEIAGGKDGKKYTYRITLLGSDDVTTTWVEFLVDTADKIPGVVQLGVNWFEQ